MYAFWSTWQTAGLLSDFVNSSLMKYYNEFAELYDDVSKGLTGELEFYLKEAKKAKGKVLEAACGTGRILLPLLEAGIDIEGFDISKSMLDVLKQKAKKKKRTKRY